MNERLNLKHKVGRGITSQAFIGGMARNQAELLGWYDRFTWHDKENPDRNAPDYQEKVSQKRHEIAEVYNAGTAYQNVVIQELKTLFASL